MNDMKRSQKPLVLVTGSEGLIGKRVGEELRSDYRVIGMDILPAATAATPNYFQCDLTDDPSVRMALSRVREQYGSHLAGVVHLAAYYDFSGKPSPLYEELTVQGTKRLVDELQSFQVGLFLFSSSLLVMKPVNENESESEREAAEPLTETSEVEAEWAYPRSKLEAEKVLRFAPQVPVAVFRIAGVYDDRCHSLPISHHIRRIYEKKIESLVFPGDVTNGQPFVHLHDVSSAIKAAVDRRDQLDSWGVFLIAEPEVLSHQDLQNRLGELIHGTEWPTLQVPKSAAKVAAKIKGELTEAEQFIKPWMVKLADDHYPVEINKAQQQLRWEPRHRLSETLPDMVRLLKQNPRQFYKENKLPMPEDWKAVCQDG